MNVLLAGDLEESIEELRKILARRYPHFATTSCCVRSATEVAIQRQPDLVFVVTETRSEAALIAVRGLHELSSAHVIVLGPSDAQFILKILRSGAIAFVEAGAIEDDLAEAIQRLREAPRIARLGHLISVVSAGAGCGASTISVNLAAALAKSHESSCLLDLDIEAGDLASLLNLRPEHSLADLCKNLDRMDADIFSNCLAKHESGVQLLAPPALLRDLPRVTLNGVRRAIGLARKMFNYTIADLGLPHRSMHEQALVQSETILVVMREELPSLRQALRLNEHFRELDVSLEKVQVIVNRYKRIRELSIRDIEESLGRSVDVRLPEDSGNAYYVNRGIPIVLAKPRRKLSRGFFALSARVNGRPVKG